MDALADGSTLSGSAVITYVGEGEPTVGEGVATVGEITVGLQCARQFDDQTWFLAGAVEESSGEGQPVGQWVAVTVRDTTPQQVNLYGGAEATWDNCAQFVRNIPDSAVEGPEMIGPSQGRWDHAAGQPRVTCAASRTFGPAPTPPDGGGGAGLSMG